MTGLLPPIRRQLLLKGKPETLVQAIKDAEGVEYALNFVIESESPQDINVIRPKCQDHEPVPDKLQESLDQIVKRLDALETSQKRQPPSQQSFRYYPDRPISTGRGRGRGFDRQRDNNERCCWLCGKVAHLRRQCPLNYQGSAGRMDS